MTDAERPELSDDAAPAASVPRGLPSGWVQLSAATLRERLAVPQNLAVWGVWGVLEIGRFVSIFVRDGSSLDVGSLVTTSVITLAVAVAAVFFALPFVAPIAEANFDLGLVRWRHRTRPFTEVVTAELVLVRNRYDSPVDGLTLSIGTGKGVKVPFALRVKEKVVLDVRRRTLLAEVIRRSNIAYPVDPYDPKGKFARYNFPGALTREEALEIVLHPPGPNDPLPMGE